MTHIQFDENDVVDPMYCPECDEMVPDIWDPIREDWHCEECDSVLYEDKETYIEVTHAAARWQWERDNEPSNDKTEIVRKSASGHDE